MWSESCTYEKMFGQKQHLHECEIAYVFMK